MEETKEVDVGKGVIFHVPVGLDFIRKVGNVVRICIKRGPWEVGGCG